MTSRTCVVKVGGEVATDAASVGVLFDAVSALGRRVRVVLVHGGGALATTIAARFGQEPKIVAGRRVTSDTDLQAILWSVCGEINTRLVSNAGARGINAVGLTGADAHLVQATRRSRQTIDQAEVDFGNVGDIDAVDPTVIEILLRHDLLPIVATLGASRDGHLLNINADTVACRIAAATSAELILVTPSGGVYRSFPDKRSLFEHFSAKDLEEGVTQGWISGGMRVKLDEAFRALRDGVTTIRICDVHGIASGSGTIIRQTNS